MLMNPEKHMRYIAYYPTTLEIAPAAGAGAMLRELFAATPLYLFIEAARGNDATKSSSTGNHNGHNGRLSAA